MKELKYDGATFHMPLRNEKGEPIGMIRLREDGTFTGELSSGTIFTETGGELFKLGYARGIAMYPIVEPALRMTDPPCDLTFSHTRETCGNSGCRER